MKHNFKMTILFSVFLFIAACNTETPETDTNQQDEVTISLTITDHTTDTVIDEAEYSVTNETILLDILDENYSIEVTEEGFLTTIEGASQNADENIFWLYEVNGEMANEGIAEYEVKDEDEITLDLQELE